MHKLGVLVAGLALGVSMLTISPSQPAAAGGYWCFGYEATIVGEGVINGTAGADVIVGSWEDDIIKGNGGNDVICGRGGNDKINGNSGHDLIGGGKGDDWIAGDAGNDEIYGKKPYSFDAEEAEEVSCTGGCSSDDDQIYGGSGSDWILDFTGSNLIDGGSNGDWILGTGELRGGGGDDGVGADPYWYGDGVAVVEVCQNGQNGCVGSVIDGGSGNDWLIGSRFDDEIKGQSGNDELESTGGADLINGGSGRDECEVTPDDDTVISCEEIDED